MGKMKELSSEFDEVFKHWGDRVIEVITKLPEGKGNSDIEDVMWKREFETIFPKCTCGTWAAHGRNVPKDVHSEWCDLRS